MATPLSELETARSSLGARADEVAPLLGASDRQHTTVYRFFDVDGDLLYVGITGRGKKRTSQHAADKRWWPQVASATFSHYPSRAAAADAEAKAIRDEHPLYNIARGRRPWER
jgi:GIY-YIG catalytic domain-containing protein